MRKGIAALAVSVCAVFCCVGISAAEEVWTSYVSMNDSYAIAVDGDHIWTSSAMGPCRWTIPAPGEGATYELFTEEVGTTNIASEIIVLDDACWFAIRDEGLFRYQAGEWTLYSTENSGLPDNRIWGLAGDKQGHLWIATSGGVSKFDGVTWTNYTSADGLLEGHTRTIEIDSNNVVWCSGRDGLSSYSIETDTWSTYTLDNSGIPDVGVTDMAIDSLNRLWLTTYSSGLISYDGSEWNTWTTDNGLPTNELSLISIDNTDTMWIGMFSGGVFSYDRENATVYDTTGNGLKYNCIWDIFADEANTVWFVATNGISSFDGEKWTQVDDPYGPADNWMTSVAVDSENVKWFGTAESGLSSFDGRTWAHYGIADGLPDSRVNDIAFAPDGTMWLATAGGAASYDGETWATYTTENSALPHDYVFSVDMDSNNGVWFGTAGGAAQLRDDQWTGYTEDDGLAIDYVTNIAIVGGNVWFCSADYSAWSVSYGVSVLHTDDNSWTYHGTYGGHPSDSVGCFHVDRNGVLWTGTYGDGVGRYDGSKWTGFTEDDGLASDMIRCVASGLDNGVWAGSWDGVSFYDGETWTVYNEENSDLHCDFITDAAVDADGTMWFATFSGVARFGAPDDGTLPTGVDDDTPLGFSLAGNYPNPFNGMTTINFSIENTSPVTLAVYNIAGQKVRELHTGILAAGQHSLVWDGRNDYGQTTSTGVYIARLEANGHVGIARMLFMK